MGDVAENLPKEFNRIHILPDQVVNQIAAGEVVERPASVVKELVENSIDAGATFVTVSIANGGQTLIEVLDNGVGMSAVDAELAVKRFGTSKIYSVTDLDEIGTFGFRGEALASIASVSKFELQTARSDGDEQGTILSIEGGAQAEVSRAAVAPGTRIKVSGLFYNVPARRRFLKSEATETGNIRTILSDIALANPALRIRFVVDGRESLQFAPAKDFFARCGELKFGGEEWLQVEGTREEAEGQYQLSGVISKPLYAVPTTNKLRLIVNGRVVRDKLILKAVRDGYGNMLRPGRSPAGVVSFTLPAREVDVNVHPQKSEVRFRSSDRVYRFLRGAVERAVMALSPDTVTGVLGQSSPHNYQSTPVWEREAASRTVQVSWIKPPLTERGLELPENRTSNGVSPGIVSQQRSFLPEPSLSPQNRAGSTVERLQPLSSFRFVGQIFKCFLLLEGAEQFAIVDMHAAHERTTYYKLKSAIEREAPRVQYLLVPETIDLSISELSAFEDAREVLEKLGFEFELVRDGQLMVRAVPAVLARFSARTIIRDVCAEGYESNGAERGAERFIDAVITRLACHGSVRSGRELEREEVYALLEALEEADASALCPHGRPVFKRLTRYELEGWFGRVMY